MRKYTKTRRYHLSNELLEKLDQLKKYRIVESRFVRLAIEEKLERDLPKLKIKQEKQYCPF